MTDPGLARPAASMATGTVLSRVTGMVRNTALVAAIGTGVFADTYTVANTLPNILYILTAGGALNAVLIPQLVRRMKADADGGVAYTDRLLTAIIGVLLLVTALALLAAPWLIRLYASAEWSAADLRASTLFAWFCLPQILFYGAYTVLAQVLNVRGRFGAPMFAPIVNNVVVIVTAIVFIAVVTDPSVAGITDTQIALLGIGTTLGVVAQAAVLLPVLNRAGYRWRPRLDLRNSGIGRAAWLAGWTLFLVAVNQAAFVVITRLATTAGARAAEAGEAAGAGITVYSMAHLVFVLPHSVVTVSVVTAMFPRMSRHAGEGDMGSLRRDVTGGFTAIAPLLIPASVALVLFATPVAVLLFNYGATDLDSAQFIGETLRAFAVGLVPFSAYFVMMRGFYAVEDTRTPALLAIPLGVLNVGLGYLFFQALPAQQAVAGLAFGYSLAYLIMLLPMWLLLRRRYGGLPVAEPISRSLRLLAAAMPAGLLGFVAAVFVLQVLDLSLRPVTALLWLGVAGAVMAPVFVLLARWFGVPDVLESLRTLTRRLRSPRSGSRS